MNNAAATPTVSQIYKVALAAIIGSVIEQYDFLVTGVIAATVWGGRLLQTAGPRRRCGRHQRLRSRHHHPSGRRLHLRQYR